MTQKECIDMANKAIKELNAGGYIKGFGAGKYRLMDKKSNPIVNFDSRIFALLTMESKVKQKDLIWIESWPNMAPIPYPEKTKKRR